MGAAFCDSDPDKKYLEIQIFSPRQSQQVLCSKIRTTLDFCSFSSRGEGHSFLKIHTFSKLGFFSKVQISMKAPPLTNLD